MTDRKPISKRRRFEIFKRDQFTCQYCGAHPPEVILHIDHIVPVVEGGSNDDDNLITACAGCNLGKGAVPLHLAPKSLEERAEEVAEREAQLAGFNEIMMAARQRLEDDTWRVVELLEGDECESYPKRDFESIKMFVDKLGLPDTMDAADMAKARISSGRAMFKYFCGICWNWIRDGRD